MKVGKWPLIVRVCVIYTTFSQYSHFCITSFFFDCIKSCRFPNRRHWWHLTCKNCLPGNRVSLLIWLHAIKYIYQWPKVSFVAGEALTLSESDLKTKNQVILSLIDWQQLRVYVSSLISAFSAETNYSTKKSIFSWKKKPSWILPFTCK